MMKTFEDLHCAHFELRFEFDSSIFDSRKFVKSANLDPDLPLSVSVTANSEQPERNVHAHINLNIGETYSFLRLDFYTGNVEFVEYVERDTANSMEFRIIELGEVMPKKPLSCKTIAHFHYPRNWFTSVFLGYPVGVRELPAEAIVSGQEISIGNGKSKKRLFVSEFQNRPFVSVSRSRSVKLGGLIPEKLVSQDALLANALVSSF